MPHSGSGLAGTPFILEVNTVSAGVLLLAITVVSPVASDGISATVSGGGLSWSLYSSVTQSTPETIHQEIWSAEVGSPLTSQNLTIAVTATSGNTNITVGAVALGIIDTGGFDPASGLPGTASNFNTASPFVTYDTSSADDLLLCFTGLDANAGAPDPSGWTNEGSYVAATGIRTLVLTLSKLTPGAVLTGQTTTSGAGNPAISSMILLGLLPSAQSCDPYFDDVVLLLPMTGTAGATATTDVSNVGNTVDLSNAHGATIETASPPVAGVGYLDSPIGNYFLAAAPIAVPFTTGSDTDIFSNAADAWTIEFWARSTSSSQGQTAFLYYGGAVSSSAGGGFNIQAVDSGSGSLQVGFQATCFGDASLRTQSFSAAEGSWNHYAATWDGTTGRVFFNGVQLTFTESTWSPGNYTPVADPGVIIGANRLFTSPTDSFDMAQFRATKGVARYTSNFTPSVNAVPEIQCASCDPDFGDVSLLMPFDGSIVDVSLNALSFTNSGASTESSQVKFGSGALNLPAALAYASTPIVATGPLDYGTGDYTIECWIYGTVNNPGGNGMICWGGSDNQTNSNYPLLTLNNVSGPDIAVVAGGLNTGFITGSMSAAAWHHIALTNDAGTQTLWIDGVSAGTASNIIAVTTSPDFIVGPNHFNSGDPQAVIGFMDELRVTKGIARYTSNFTPSVVAFADISCTPTVPDLIGLSISAAETALTDVGFTIGTETPVASGAPINTVVSQTTPAGTVETLPFTVGFSYSEGLTVPDVVGLQLAVAAEVIVAAGFSVGPETVSYGFTPIGQITAQSPAGGSLAASGSPISIVVANGPQPLVMPNVLGETTSQAISDINVIGLVVFTILTEFSDVIPAGQVLDQNPAPGATVYVGQFATITVSQGPFVPPLVPIFDPSITVIAQYANSPTMLQLIQNMAEYLRPDINLQTFFDFVWNVETAQDWGLDIWGSIVGITRLLHIPNSAELFGFHNSTVPPGVVPFGQGVFNSKGGSATQTYLLPDSAYRILILTKALSNISATTAPAINQILQNLFPGRGNAFVEDLGGMAMQYTFQFVLTVVESAIIGQSGALPHGAGVAVSIVSE